MNEDKSSRYHRLRRRASVTSTILGVVFLVAFVWTRRLGGASRPATALAGGSFLLTICCYVVMLALINEAISVPLAFYQGVTLERRYGLSTQTTARWWLDHLKAGLVALVFALIAATARLLVDPVDADRWWMLDAAAFTVILVVLVQLAPVVLLPLFYEFKPLDRERW
jgi:STE24 endopeptidase